ncbi:MAG: hypothetical protein NTV34_02095 [Proteobacteria bacterium]|nr:hypothetical protein [Pseudomonadota bacterium]
MNKWGRFSYILLLSLNAASFSASAASEKVTLHVGEQKHFQEIRAVRISVSRRGIIHLIEEGTGLWRATGLRSGVAAATLILKGGEKRLIYFDVTPRPQSKANPTRSNSEEVVLAALKPMQKAIFSLRAKIELVETQTMESIGGTHSAGASIDLIKPSFTVNALGILEELNRSQVRNVLGEPSFLVGEDEEATIKSGGESMHEQQHHDGKIESDWHEYGMALTTKVTRIDENKLGLTILFILKTPSSGDNRYSINQIQTYSKLSLDSRQLIGTVDLASDAQSGSKDIFLSQVPIIGPFFKHSATSLAKATLRLWMEASEMK